MLISFFIILIWFLLKRSFLLWLIFYAQRQLLLFAHLSHRSSVCPSVRLSVCPFVLSHGWIGQKRTNLRFLANNQWIFLAILGCDTSIYHSQDCATQV